jgi:hypothetical protein
MLRIEKEPDRHTTVLRLLGRIESVNIGNIVLLLGCNQYQLDFVFGAGSVTAQPAPRHLREFYAFIHVSPGRRASKWMPSRAFAWAAA